MKAIEMLEIVAAAIADLPIDVTFTGGATIPLYLDAIAALEVRPTDDVDCVVEVTTQVGYYQLAAPNRSDFSGCQSQRLDREISIESIWFKLSIK
jgi:hypothetical protein